VSAIQPLYGWDGLKITYEVSVTVLGGQLVMVDGSTGKVKITTANAMPLGIAMTDAAPAGTSDTTVDAWGNSVINASLPGQYTAVAMEGVFKINNAGAALILGDYVKATAAGDVTKATVGTDVIIGKVVGPAAGAGTGEKAHVRLALAPSGNIT